MKIEPNMYVRTKCGNIFKIIGGNVDNWEIDIDYSKLEQTEEYWLELYRYNDNYSFFDDKNIIKSSFNIIDLIERFDLVNGHLVICKMYENEKDMPTIVKCVGDYYFKEEDIKSIATKEQFEGMQYVIK